MENKGRRDFLLQAGAVIAGSVLVGAPALQARGNRADGPDCESSSAVSGNQMQRRRTYRYTDNGTRPRVCANCQNFQPAPGGTDECGGCTVVPGPVSPLGWCRAWTEAMGQAG